MEEQLLIKKPTKLKYTTATVKVKSCIFNEGNRPVKLITSGDTKYSFPKMISTNECFLIQLKKHLTYQNKIEIVYDNLDRIHNVNNIQFSWDENNHYKLMLLSWTKGLLFNDYIEVSFIENVFKFYKTYGYEKLFIQGSEITIIIKDILPIDIPIKY